MQNIIFACISLIGGLAFFMFGMKFMSQNLEQMTGGMLEKALRKMTSNPVVGLGLGIAITVAMQSSSATTVMLVGLVNSGIMQFGQTISIIFGSNIGTTLTSWILSLSSISSENFFLQILKPENFSPIVAFVGILMIMLSKSDKKKNIGNVCVGFALLMYGMTIMSKSISPLAETETFKTLLIEFNNPIIALLIGLVVTAIIQSSAASIGILQALSITGSLTFYNVIPIIMGQNIGTCATSLISCIGTKKNSKKVALLHLSIKIFGTIICLTLYLLLNSIFKFAFSNMSVNPFTIALIHTLFNVIITIILAPFSKLLINFIEKIVGKEKEVVLTESVNLSLKEKAKVIAKKSVPKLDDRLFRQPSMALSECNNASRKMAMIAKETLETSINNLKETTNENFEKVIINEEIIDRYEDKLGTYLVKLSSKALSDFDTRKISKILHTLSDFERLGDHAVDILHINNEMHEKRLKFSKHAQNEIEVLSKAINKVVDLTTNAYINNDIELAKKVEPLEQVIDKLIVEIKDNHINRLQLGNCSIQMGFILSDLLTAFKRVSDHCSNIAVAIIKLGLEENNYDTHKYLNYIKDNDKSFEEQFNLFSKEYVIEK